MSVFVIADAGTNARVSLHSALALVDAAAKAGADAVKFQLWHADHLYAKGSDRHREARRWALPEKWLSTLKARCDERSIEFMCSAFCLDALDAVDPLVKRHKIAGIEAHDAEFVMAVLERGKPTLLTRSLGLPAWKVWRYRLAALWLRGELTVLHGVTAYPTPLGEVGLSAHPRLRWGVSDHTVHPTLVPVAAVALGARAVEKHLRLARQTKTPDAAHSLDPRQFSEMVRAIRYTEHVLARPAVRESEQPYLGLRRKGGLRGGPVRGDREELEAR